MKKFLVLLALLIQTAFAQNIVVEDIKQVSAYVPACPFCMGGVIKTDTTITFSNYSCARFSAENFFLNIEKKIIGTSGATEIYVTVEVQPFLKDCKGPTKKYEYSLTTEELESATRYILTNPSVLK